MIRLKELRQNAGLSQYSFAKEFGVAQNTVSNWETGNRLIDSETALKLANFFNVSTDYLLGNSNQKKAPNLDEQLEGIDFALYGEVHDLTDEEKKDIIDYIKFKKSQREG